MSFSRFVSVFEWFFCNTRIALSQELTIKMSTQMNDCCLISLYRPFLYKKVSKLTGCPFNGFNAFLILSGRLGTDKKLLVKTRAGKSNSRLLCGFYCCDDCLWMS
jgi:hypothetical protein